jgi:hypothetical protein
MVADVDDSRHKVFAESIKPGISLKSVPISLTEISRDVAANASSDQPRIWTVIRFEATVGANRLAESFSGVLDDAPSRWYCNFTSGDEGFIVYPKKVFRYPRGDVAGRLAAQSFGRSIGVPPTQLDWEE